MATQAPALLSSGTTPARAALSFGTDDFARMPIGKLRRVYAAALAAAREHIADAEDMIAYIKEDALNGTAIAAIQESPVRPRATVAAVAHTYALVTQLVSELTERDTLRIPASPETRELDSFEELP